MNNKVNNEAMTHQSTRSTMILLVNLGTPKALKSWAVFKFLKAFLLDRRVVRLPWLFWWLILHVIILPLRTNRVLKLYKSIWTQEGSPLQVFTERLAIHLEKKFKEQGRQAFEVHYAMTYGAPEIPTCLKRVIEKKIERLIIIPLFPQFSTTTTGAIFDKITDFFKKSHYIPSLSFIHEYASTDLYLKALEESILEHYQYHGRPERLLFSFHGIPARYETAGDPYPQQCRTLALSMARRLNFPENFWALSFQSRFGFDAWVEPSTDEILKRWAQQGIKSIAVLSPSFSVDCLETLEELNIQYRKKFIHYGGGEFLLHPRFK